MGLLPLVWEHLRNANEVVGLEGPKLLIIVPSRGRPENAQRLLDQILSTTSSDDEVYVTFAVDHDDPTQFQYPPLHTETVVGGSMVKALNEMTTLENTYDFEYLAFLGDDTLPRGDWYARIMEALQSKKNSIVYGNDLIHGEGLPTSVFMDANIVHILGYMAPPNQKQLFVDNYWKALGEALGTLQYLPEAIIEHLHPIVQKAPSDASYEQAYSEDRWADDEKAFKTYMESQFELDLEKLR